MKLNLPAHNLFSNLPVPIEFPDSWDVRIHTYHGVDAAGLTREEIAQALRAPSGGVPIAQDARGCKTAVIIVDDITRPTPAENIAKEVIAQLEEAGLERKNIHFMFALGMHRSMSRDEYILKLGEEIVSEFRIYNHNPFFNNIRVGVTSTGIPIELNADCVAADYKVGIGTLVPHPHTGIAGGAKLIVPGIASAETIRRYHLQPAHRWDLGTPGRKITVEAADMLGLNCKIDVLLNGRGEVARLVAGSCRDNLEKNYDEIVRFYTVPRPEPAELVVANNYFKPSEPDASSCYPSFYSLIKPGGQLVVSAHTPLGAIPHYMFGRWGENCIGGLLYTGERKLPKDISCYVAFSRYMDRGTAVLYHYDDSDPRVHWARKWEEVIEILGHKDRSVLVLPYTIVPYFDPPLQMDQN
ncbi:MAG: lactate racemase domain-containing protein [Clostridia bacterium]